MKTIRNISVFIFSAIFLVSASGILIFHAHCICSGNKQVSVYVTPETCEDNFHVHHTHEKSGEVVCTSENECHECNNTHNDNCGCNSPDVRYIKLESQLVHEKVRVEKLQPAQLKVLQAIAVSLFSFNYEQEKPGFNYIDPPPPFPTSTDFLIQIHQLKIPFLA